MTTFFEELVAEYNKLDGVLEEPEEELGKDYEVMGELEPSLRRLYVIQCRFLDDSRGLKAATLRLAANLIERKEDETMAAALESTVDQGILAILKAEVARTIFWNSVRIAFFDLVGKEHITVGRGWKVGWKKEEEEERA